MVRSVVFLSKITSTLRNHHRALLIFVVFFAVSFLIGYRDINNSGPLWHDASQYANAGAMVHDYLLSGDILRPYSFAKQNYFQYPAFHMPYHPPAYPSLLGLFFLVTGVSYFSARFFVVLCLATAGGFFYAILKGQGITSIASFSGAVLLLTIPEVAFWTRDTMSEVPALMLIIAASYLFLRWMKTTQFRHYLMALCLAEAAFLSRYLTAGVLLGWLLWLLLLGDWRRLITRSVVLAAVIFLLLNFGWVLFTLQFSKYETPLGGVTPTTNYVPMLSLKPLSYYLDQLPFMMGSAILIMALAAFIYLVYKKMYRRLFFWLSWLFCYAFFLTVLGIFNERRYFLFALPVFPGLVAEFIDLNGLRKNANLLLLIIVGVCLLSNGYKISKFPRGVVGYEAVGKELATIEGPGNVLVALGEQADLIFRFRTHSPYSDRVFIRADRTLVIRPPSYADAKAVNVASSDADVLDLIRRGRIRYLVTSSPVFPGVDDRTQEMITLDNLARSQPQNFQLVKTFPLLREYSRPGSSWQVFLWKFLGELPQNQTELPVLIPTADMEIKPPS